MTAKTDDQLIDDFLAQPGIPINPELPANWDSTPHDARPDCHRKLWGRPYIVTWTPTEQEADLTAFKKHWPTGTRYTVRCLDGGSWDRSTNCGSFATAVEATEQAQQLPRDYSPRYRYTEHPTAPDTRRNKNNRQNNHNLNRGRAGNCRTYPGRVRRR